MDNVVNLADIRKQREQELNKSVSGDISRSIMALLIEEYKARGFDITDPVFIETLKGLAFLTKGMIDFNMQMDTNTAAYFKMAFDQFEDYLPKFG